MEGTGVEWRGGKGRAGQGRVPDCLGGLSRVGISSRSTRPWNGQPPSSSKIRESRHAFIMRRCHGLSVYAVCVCNKVRLPGTGQSAHVIGGSRFTRPASNSRRTLLN